MLASYLLNGFETAETLTPAAGAIIAGHAVELLAQALGESRSSEPAPSNAWREALFVRACRMIGLRFGDPDLAPDRIARELGISTRLLQRVLAERDKTVMRHVLEERVVRAAKLLGAPDAAHRSITDIAFACGFNDSAHFTRAFAARMEMTPSQWRKQAQ
jgi:AraC family transcriptional regulator, positive regulator of tynA and feaB